MAIYKVTETNGDTWLLQADMVRAEAPISYDYHQEGDGWISTPFQTANARHEIGLAAQLVLHYIDRESCAEDDDMECDCADRIKSIDDISSEDEGRPE